MKKKIGLLLLLITVVSVGAVFAQQRIPMTDNGNSRAVMQDLVIDIGGDESGGGERILSHKIKVLYCARDKKKLEMWYQCTKHLIMGGKFFFTVFYNDGTWQDITNNEITVPADKTIYMNIKVKQPDQVKGIQISFFQTVKDKQKEPKAPPKPKKDWVDRNFPPLNLK